MQLYSYFRSSAAYRVRIALNLKRLDYDIVPVHLLKSGGEQFAPAYRQLNADALIPTLLDEAAGALTQSLAIIEYLEETYPAPALLPVHAIDRAYVRSIALAIACDIHPLNNLRVMRYLKNSLHVDDAARDDWYRHWCQVGLEGLEARLSRDARVGKFCYGDTPTLADCCLAPQFFNAKRLNCDLSVLPTVQRINDACLALDAFASAAPDRQPDAE
ncbi:MAG: maleylacetoacetate isomerase [Proteobacteria bacterium]|nr:maleylacetoacetate isomerase [Pseudomonadota bacterium]